MTVFAPDWYIVPAVLAGLVSGFLVYAVSKGWITRSDDNDDVW